MALELEAGVPPPQRRRRARPDLTTPGLLGLPLAWLVVFFVLPIGIVAAYSFDVLLALPGRPRLHAHGVAGGRTRSGVPPAVLEVREDVADGFGDHRPPRLPACVLPGALGHEAQVRPSPRPHRSVPDELPPARARLEGDPRRPGRRQHVSLLDRAPFTRSSAFPAPLQPIRGDARSGLHLVAVRRVADLRLARESRPPSARGRERPRGKSIAGIPTRDAAALPAGGDCGVLLRVHPDARRVRHAVARRRSNRLHVRQPDRGSVRDGIPGLGDRLGPRSVPARRRRRF